MTKIEELKVLRTNIAQNVRQNYLAISFVKLLQYQMMY